MAKYIAVEVNSTTSEAGIVAISDDENDAIDQVVHEAREWGYADQVRILSGTLFSEVDLSQAPYYVITPISAGPPEVEDDLSVPCNVCGAEAGEHCDLEKEGF